MIPDTRYMSRREQARNIATCTGLPAETVRGRLRRGEQPEDIVLAGAKSYDPRRTKRGAGIRTRLDLLERRVAVLEGRFS